MKRETTCEEMLAAVKQLPPLSEVVTKVLLSFEQKNIDVDDIANKINLDSGMATRILRVANSAFYGFSNQVGTVHEAVVLLGFHNVRSLVVAAGLIKQFPSTDEQQFDQDAFWRHNIGTGVCARLLANSLGKDGALAFTAGLLHDIGRLAMAVYCQEKFSQVVAQCKQNAISMLEAEQAVLGMDHGQIGFAITQRWHFPIAIQAAIRDHHQPEKSAEFMSDIVHVANVLCHAMDIGNVDNDSVPAISAVVWERIGLSWRGIKMLLPEIERQNAAASLLLND